MRLVDSYSPGKLFSVEGTSGWSSDSKHYAFTGETDHSQVTLGIITPDVPKRAFSSGTGGFLTNAHWSTNNRFVYMDGALLDAIDGTRYDVSNMELEFASDNIFWSANSRHLIALLHDGVLMEKVAAWQVYSLDNHQLTTLHDIWGSNADPVNPDRVVVARLDPNGNMAIELMDMDGSRRTTLLNIHAAPPTPDADYTQMEWSPDGMWIAVMACRTALKAGLTVVRTDGFRLTRYQT